MTKPSNRISQAIWLGVGVGIMVGGLLVFLTEAYEAMRRK